MNKKRLLENFIEMVEIHSPSKKEGKYADYLIDLLNDMGAEIYLDKSYGEYGGEAPTIIGKFPGDVEGEGISLAAHMDVIEPNLNVNPIIEGNIIKTDGTTTLGGDDKAGVACIIETIRTIKEDDLSHEDIYVVLTPAEEIGMLGAKNIDWDKLPENMMPAKNMIVVDNAGKAGVIGHSAPSKFAIDISFKGKKAHAGVEPESGINAITMAAIALSNMEIGRIDDLTTSNISTIEADFPSNVVPESCELSGEIRGHSEERIMEIIDSYKKACEEAAEKLGGSYEMSYQCDYPVLKPKDDLKFAKEFAEVCEELDLPVELQVSGGGSDGNIFAERGFNPIVIAMGMYKVHTVEEYLEIEEMNKATEAMIEFIVSS